MQWSHVLSLVCEVTPDLVGGLVIREREKSIRGHMYPMEINEGDCLNGPLTIT